MIAGMKAMRKTDLCVLNRGAGWLQFRSARAKGRDEKAAFDDLIHVTCYCNY
jgi:hypothetical protein